MLDVAAWNERKLAQWDRVRETLPGLQLSRTGSDKSTFILRCSVEAFEDAIIIGRLGGDPIDITDATLLGLIDLWRVGRKISDSERMPRKYDPNFPGHDYVALEPVRKAQRAALKAARIAGMRAR